MLLAALAGNFALSSAVLAGIAGGIAMLVVIYGGRAMGMTRMDLLKMLGTMMMPKAPDTTAYGVGLMMHLMMSAAFGLVHAGILHGVGVDGSGAAIGIGLAIGVVHGAMVTVALPVMVDALHPLVRSGEMASPGPLMRGYGPMTPAGVVMAHVAFGLVTGLVYYGAVG